MATYGTTDFIYPMGLLFRSSIKYIYVCSCIYVYMGMYIYILQLCQT